MKFPLRLYGIENEFAVVGKTSDGAFLDIIDNSKVLDLIQVRPIKNSVLAKEALRGAERVWHTNGSCTYVDTGDHPEHATAECSSVRDIVKYNKAGEILVSRVFDPKYAYPPKTRVTALAADNIELLLFKNNLGYTISADTTGICGQFGCHENYSLSTDRLFGTALDYHQKMELLKPLIPFLATRQIFDGSGWWETNGAFHLSQRAYSIQKEIGSGAMHDRSFFQMKTGDTGADMRLHIVSGDANMCEFALYLKLGTTSLVLALIESGYCPIFECKDMVRALKQISRYGDPHMRLVQIKNKSALSALEVQSIFFEALRAQLTCAHYASEEIEEEVKRIMLYWEQTLNAVYNRDDKWMRGRIDHVTKRYLAEMQIRKTGVHDVSQLSLIRKTIDIMYHCVSNPTLQERIRARWPERRIVSDDEICHCLLHAPPNTRARMRGIFVQTLIDKGKSIADYITWNQLTMRDGLKIDSLDLPYGFISHSDKFEKFLLLVK